MTNAPISIDSIRYEIGGTSILNTMSLDIAEHRIAIIGRNGSGKSTLARILCGLIQPTQGRVNIDQIDVYRDRKAAISRIGILFQNPDHQIIFPTVGEEMAFGLRQLGQSKADVENHVHQMLRQFGKPDWYDRAIVTLSQGQRQLVCLMAVLAMGPKVLVLDEPFSGLDIPTTRTLSAYLDPLPQTILHITHDPKIALTCDRVIWIETGTIVQDGTPSDVVPAFLNAMNTAVDL